MRNGRLAVSVCGFLSGFLLVSSVARADVYHAVARGETLSAVAAKYRVSVADLRAANGLKGDDNAALPAMLLRVPGVSDASAPALTNLTNSAPALASASASASFGSSAVGGSAAAAPTSRGSGFIAQVMNETVRAGDTWDTIAARYQAAGHNVTVSELRRRNGWAEMPAAGQTIVVPLGQMTYVAPSTATGAAPRIATSERNFPGTPVSTTTVVAQKTPPVITPNAPRARSLGDGVTAAGEASALPVARDATPTQGPVYGAANPLPLRGSLASRGGYGQLARSAAGGGLQILSPGQDAPAPRGGVIGDVSDTVSQPVVTGANIARVANVELKGATIRRLPDPTAAILFNCKQGTQLAVLKSSGMWSAVLMSDASTGWVPTKYLKLTDQTIDVSQQMRPTEGPGGDAVYSVGAYSTRSRTVAQALRWLGTPYVYGGTSRRGIDCSAMVQNSFKSCGVNLPRTAAQQAKVGQVVQPQDLQPGDRLYFSASGTRVDHTGLYMGDGLFVHASGSGRRVMVSKLFQGRNWNIFVGARR